jgi:hypothetical protein
MSAGQPHPHRVRLVLGRSAVYTACCRARRLPVLLVSLVRPLHGDNAYFHNHGQLPAHSVAPRRRACLANCDAYTTP